MCLLTICISSLEKCLFKSFAIFKKIYLLFIYFYVCVGLRFCARAFSSCDKWGPLFIVVRGPLIITASLVAEHRLQMRRLNNCGSRTQLLCGMWDLPRPGLEPVSPALAGRFSTTAPPGKPFCHFLNWIVWGLCCWVVGALYIFWISIPCYICSLQIPPPTLSCIFTLLIVSFDVQKFLTSMKSNLTIFFFCCLPVLLMSYPRNHCQIQCHEYLPLFSSKNFIVLNHMFRSLVHFNFL